MNLDNLDLFLDVARAGGFAAAARRRGADPSTISRAVAALEADLGVRLFERTTRRVSLTEAGRLFLNRAPALVEEARHLRNEAADLRRAPRGELRLTASASFGLRRVAPLLPTLRAALPEVRYRLRFTDAVLDLAGEGVDLALRLGPRPQGDVVAARLAAVRRRVYAAPALLRGRPLTSPESLATAPCVRLDLRGWRDAWTLRGPDDAVVVVEPDGPVTAAPADAARQAAVDGLGAALLAEWLAAEDVAAGRLVDALPGWRSTAETALWLVYPSRRFLPAKTRAVADLLRGMLTTARLRAPPHASVAPPPGLCPADEQSARFAP